MNFEFKFLTRTKSMVIGKVRERIHIVIYVFIPFMESVSRLLTALSTEMFRQKGNNLLRNISMVTAL